MLGIRGGAHSAPSGAVCLLPWTPGYRATYDLEHRFEMRWWWGGVVGSNSRYDRDLPVTSLEADEARALHVIGQVVVDKLPLALDRARTLELAEVMHATAIELGNGRPVPLGVRRAVLRLANGLREALDPRTVDQRSGPDATEAATPGTAESR